MILDKGEIRSRRRGIRARARFPVCAGNGRQCEGTSDCWFVAVAAPQALQDAFHRVRPQLIGRAGLR